MWAILSSGALGRRWGRRLAGPRQPRLRRQDERRAARRYIAIAAVVFGRWTPLGAAGACLLFGFSDALQIQLQNSFANAPRELLQILPYVVTIAALVFSAPDRWPRARLAVPWKYLGEVYAPRPVQLKDVKAIVTGGAQGMGAHFACRLAEAGAQVCAGDVNEARLAELPSSVKHQKLDVSDEKQCESFVAWAHQSMGGLNVLINNAGILRDGLLVKKDRTTGEVKKLSTEQWRAVIDVNLSGATFMVREFAAKLATTDTAPGVIVNMSSIARYGNRGQSNYVAAKAALAANTVTWAREFAALGIRVGAIAPRARSRRR